MIIAFNFYFQPSFYSIICLGPPSNCSFYSSDSGKHERKKWIDKINKNKSIKIIKKTPLRQRNKNKQKISKTLQINLGFPGRSLRFIILWSIDSHFINRLFNSLNPYIHETGYLRSFIFLGHVHTHTHTTHGFSLLFFVALIWLFRYSNLSWYSLGSIRCVLSAFFVRHWITFNI